MGTPCRKYRRHSTKKFFLSVGGRSVKLVVAIPGVWGVTGGSWSREKLVLDMKRFARADEEDDSEEVSRLRISMLEFISS